jgi:hypothetical protein
VVLLEIVFDKIFGRKFYFTKGSLDATIRRARSHSSNLSKSFQKEIVIHRHALPPFVDLLSATEKVNYEDQESQTMR